MPLIPRVQKRGLSPTFQQGSAETGQQAVLDSHQALGKSLIGIVDAGLEIGAGVLEQRELQKAESIKAQELRKKEQAAQLEITNEHTAKELESEFAVEKRKLLFDGDKDDPTGSFTQGFFAKTGTRAVEDRETIEKKLQSLRTKIGGSRKNPQIEQLFHDATEKNYQRDLDQISKHSLRQNVEAASSASDARVEAAGTEAISNFRDDRIVFDELTKAENEITRFGIQSGLPAEVIAQKKLAFTSTTFPAIVDQYLANGEFKQAKAFFENNKDDIDGKLHAGITKKIKTSLNIKKKLNTKAVTDAKKFVQKFGRLPDQWDETKAEVSAVNTDKGDRALKDMKVIEASLNVINKVKDMTLEDQKAMLDHTNKEASSVSAVVLQEMLEPFVRETEQAAREGKLLELEAERSGLEIEPIDVTDPESVAKRESQRDAVAEKYETDVPPLTGTEVDGIVSTIEESNARKVVETFQGITRNFTAEARDRVVGQISLKRPAHAVAMAVSESDPRLSTRIVEGYRLSKAKEGSQLRPTSGDKQDALSVLTAATPEAPEAISPYMGAATSLFVEERSRGNDDYELTDALAEVAPTMSYNNHSIIIPRHIEPDEFEDRVDSLTFDEMVRLGNGTPMYADGSKFKPEDSFDDGWFAEGEASLVTVGQGLYYVNISGLGYLTNEDNEPYIIDLR